MTRRCKMEFPAPESSDPGRTRQGARPLDEPVPKSENQDETIKKEEQEASLQVPYDAAKLAQLEQDIDDLIGDNMRESREWAAKNQKLEEQNKDLYKQVEELLEARRETVATSAETKSGPQRDLLNYVQLEPAGTKLSFVAKMKRTFQKPLHTMDAEHYLALRMMALSGTSADAHVLAKLLLKRAPLIGNQNPFERLEGKKVVMRWSTDDVQTANDIFDKLTELGLDYNFAQDSEAFSVVRNVYKRWVQSSSNEREEGIFERLTSEEIGAFTTMMGRMW